MRMTFTSCRGACIGLAICMLFFMCSDRAMHIKSTGPGTQAQVTPEGIIDLISTLSFSPHALANMEKTLEAISLLGDIPDTSEGQLITGTKEKLERYIKLKDFANVCREGDDLQLARKIMIGAGTIPSDYFLQSPPAVSDENSQLDFIKMEALQNTLEIKWTLDLLLTGHINCDPFDNETALVEGIKGFAEARPLRCLLFQEKASIDIDYYLILTSEDAIRTKLQEWVGELNTSLDAINDKMIEKSSEVYQYLLRQGSSAMNVHSMTEEQKEQIIQVAGAETAYQAYVRKYTELSSTALGKLIFTKKLESVLKPFVDIGKADVRVNGQKNFVFILNKHSAPTNLSVINYIGGAIEEIKTNLQDRFEVLATSTKSDNPWWRFWSDPVEITTHHMEFYILNNPAAVGALLMNNPSLKDSICDTVKTAEKSIIEERERAENYLKIFEKTELLVSVIPMGGLMAKGVSMIAKQAVVKILSEKIAKKLLTRSLLAAGSVAGAAATAASHEKVELYSTYEDEIRGLFLYAPGRLEVTPEEYDQLQKAAMKVDDALFWARAEALITIVDALTLVAEVAKFGKQSVTASQNVDTLDKSGDALHGSRQKCHGR